MPFQIQDDRGQPITALRPQDIKRAADAEDPVRAHLARHLKRAIRAESRRFSRYSFAWSVVAVVIWVSVQVFARVIGLYRYPFVGTALFWGGIVVLVIMGRELTRRRVARMVAASAVAEGICGQCCYSLKDVPIDSDGRIPCPECGAAWTPERITRPHWLAADQPLTFHDEKLPWKQALRRKFFRFITGTPKAESLIVADDRGRFVNGIDSRFLVLPPGRRAELSVPRMQSLRRAARRKGRIPRIAVSLPAFAVCFLIAFGAVALLDEREPWGALAAACVSLFFLAVAFGVNLGHGFLPPSHTARVLVADNLCGGCAASLEGAPTESDGCATCRMCGAGWKVGSVSDASNPTDLPPQTPP